MSIPSRTFGVEIEFCTEMSSEEIAELLTAAGVRCRNERYNHEVRTHWKVISDSSVSRGWELVSPILSGEDGLAAVKRAVGTLIAAGCRVDTSTGLHVHVGANDLSKDSLINLVRRYAAHENAIDSVVPAHRRNNRYAKTVQGDSTIMENFFARRADGSLQEACASIGDRFKKLNLQSFITYGTVEFRQHSGSLDGTKIANWITFCLQFVEDSIVAPAPVAPVFPAHSLGALIHERTNAIGRKFRAIAEVFMEVGPYAYVTAATLAQRANISEASIPSYISMFRDRYPGIAISARRGRGYYCECSTNTIRNIMGGTVPAPAPVPAPVPQVDRGPFGNLPIELRTYFAERAFDLR